MAAGALIGPAGYQGMGENRAAGSVAFCRSPGIAQIVHGHGHASRSAVVAKTVSWRFSHCGFRSM
jgi:hypothetical protein